MKKIISLFLSLVLCAGIMTIPVAADASAQTANIEAISDFSGASIEKPLRANELTELAPSGSIEFVESEISDSTENEPYTTQRANSARTPVQVHSFEELADTAKALSDIPSVPDEIDDKLSMGKELTPSKTVVKLPEIVVKSEESNANESGISSFSSVNQAPIADIQSLILNEESLINGQISTETQIAWLWSYDGYDFCYDPDGDPIEHYVDGNAAPYILGMLSGDIGFVTQFTVPGTYILYYYCVDSIGAYSNVQGFQIVVVAPGPEMFMGLPVENLQYTPYYTINSSSSFYNALSTFKYATGTIGNSSAEKMYGVNLTGDRAAVSLIQTSGTSGLKITVYNSQQTVVASGNGDSRNSRYSIDKGELILTGLAAGKYYVKISNANYQASTSYKLLVGDARNYDYYRQGLDNATWMPRFLDLSLSGNTSTTGRGNMADSNPTSRVYQDCYKFVSQGRTTIVLRTNVSWLYYMIVDADGNILYNSSQDTSARRTEWVNMNGDTYNYKIKTDSLTSGKTYYILISSNNSNLFGSETQRNSTTARYVLSVGDPLYVINFNDKITVSGTSISLPASNYSNYSIMEIDGRYLPYTAIANNASFNFSPSIAGAMAEMVNAYDMRVYYPMVGSSTGSLNFYPTLNSNTWAEGTWGIRVRSSKAISSWYPTMTLTYQYEFAD